MSIDHALVTHLNAMEDRIRGDVKEVREDVKEMSTAVAKIDTRVESLETSRRRVISGVVGIFVATWGAFVAHLKYGGLR